MFIYIYIYNKFDYELIKNELIPFLVANELDNLYIIYG